MFVVVAWPFRIGTNYIVLGLRSITRDDVGTSGQTLQLFVPLISLVTRDLRQTLLPLNW
jgi:hypothetical protein